MGGMGRAFVAAVVILVRWKQGRGGRRSIVVGAQMGTWRKFEAVQPNNILRQEV